MRVTLPQDGNFTSLAYDYVALALQKHEKSQLVAPHRPVYGEHGLVCVALCLGFHRSQRFARGAARKSGSQRHPVGRRPPVNLHRHTCRVRGGNQPGEGPLCSGCEGPGQSAGGEAQWMAVLEGGQRRDSTTQSPGGPRLRRARSVEL